MESPAATDSSAPSVLVIGAGVSGCACAATLASAGIHVTLVNSAMDRVGLPAYGPDLVGAGGGWSRIEETMEALPSPLRAVWLEAGMRPTGGGAVVNIDRRRVSVETKRLLELVPGLQVRQGFVVDLRVVPPSIEGEAVKVQAETIFGEVFEADAAVVAAGLSLGGRTSVGGDTVEGGRYGEPASEGLLLALKALGAEFREVVLQVGSRSAACDFDVLQQAATALAGARESALVAAGLQVVAEGETKGSWPADYPPAPHRDPTLRLRRMLVAVRNAKEGEGSLSGECLPVISPDGAATFEIYVAPDSATTDGAEDGQCAAAVETRMPVTVTTWVITPTSPAGRLALPAAHGRVWAVGRSAGADDYLQSLASGVRGGLDIVSAVRGGGDGD